MAPALEHSGRGPVDGDMRGRVEATLATGDGHVNEHEHGSTGQTRRQRLPFATCRPRDLAGERKPGEGPSEGNCTVLNHKLEYPSRAAIYGVEKTCQGAGKRSGLGGGTARPCTGPRAVDLKTAPQTDIVAVDHERTALRRPMAYDPKTGSQGRSTARRSGLRNFGRGLEIHGG